MRPAAQARPARRRACRVQAQSRWDKGMRCRDSLSTNPDRQARLAGRQGCRRCLPKHACASVSRGPVELVLAAGAVENSSGSLQPSVQSPGKLQMFCSTGAGGGRQVGQALL